MHTHMPYATALTLTSDRALDTALSQNLTSSEGERIAQAMQGADIVFLANHGVVVCGERIDYAYDDLFYLERACMVQVLAQSTGRPLAPVARELADHVAEQMNSERLQSTLFFEALRRTL